MFHWLFHEHFMHLFLKHGGKISVEVTGQRRNEGIGLEIPATYRFEHKKPSKVSRLVSLIKDQRVSTLGWSTTYICQNRNKASFQFYSALKSVVFTDCEIPDRINSYSGVNCALGTSKTIRYSGVRFQIFYCNSAGLSNVFRYNGVFVIAGFLTAGYHCSCLYLAGDRGATPFRYGFAIKVSCIRLKVRHILLLLLLCVW